jgi:hypothetical protein
MLPLAGSLLRQSPTRKGKAAPRARSSASLLLVSIWAIFMFIGSVFVVLILEPLPEQGHFSACSSFNTTTAHCIADCANRTSLFRPSGALVLPAQNIEKIRSYVLGMSLWSLIIIACLACGSVALAFRTQDDDDEISDTVIAFGCLVVGIIGFIGTIVTGEDLLNGGLVPAPELAITVGQWGPLVGYVAAIIFHRTHRVLAYLFERYDPRLKGTSQEEEMLLDDVHFSGD